MTIEKGIPMPNRWKLWRKTIAAMKVGDSIKVSEHNLRNYAHVVARRIGAKVTTNAVYKDGVIDGYRVWRIE